MSRMWQRPLLLGLLLLLTFAPRLRAQSSEGDMLTNEIRSARGRLQSEQRHLSPRQQDELAYVQGRSNYLAHAIERAIQGNKFEQAEKLLKEFPGTVDDLHPYYNPIPFLYQLAESGPDEQLKFLLDHKADPNRPGRDGEPPLLVTIRYQQWPRAQLLLEAGAQASATNAQGQGALELLFQNWWNTSPGTDPRLELLRALLERGADPFGPTGDGSHSSVVELALQRPHWQVDLPFDLLLANRPSPLRRTLNGQTALHLAASWGRTNALAFLLQAGFSPNLTNALELTPLQLLTGATPPRPGSGGGGGRPIRLPAMINSGPWSGPSGPGGSVLPSPTAVAEFLLSHGATLDVFSAAGLGRTNELAALLRTNPAALNARDGYGRTPLHYAISSLQFDSVRLLLRAGAALAVATSTPVPEPGGNTSLAAGLTPLHLATKRDSFELAQMLLRAGASASPADQSGNTPLHLAACNWRTNIVALLIAAHAALDVTNQASQTPLHLAAVSGSGDNLELLLTAHADPAFGLGSNTLVHIAAAHGNTQGLTVLLRHNFPVDCPDGEGQTPLAKAVAARSWEALNLLRSKGANPNAQDLHGNTALHLTTTMQDDLVYHEAAQPLWERWKRDWLMGGGLRQQTLSRLILWKVVSAPPGSTWTNTSLTAWLLEHGAKPNLTNRARQTPLHVLCSQPWLPYSNGRGTNQAMVLLQAGARVEQRDAAGLSCLHVAATNAPPTLLNLLLQHVAQPNTLRDSQGYTPLHYAARPISHGSDDHSPRLSALLAGGLSPDTPDNQGRSALHVAVATYSDFNWRRESLVLTLLTNRANPNVQDAQGFTPLHTAMQAYANNPGYHIYEVCLLLVTNHAQLNLTDRQGRTPLHILANTTTLEPTGHLKELLLNYKWDFAARDRTGQTPVHLWCSNLNAAYSQNAELLRGILTNQHLIELTNGLGDTPLHTATRAGQSFTVSILLRAGANPARRDGRGETAYRLATEKWDPSGQIDAKLRPAGARSTFFNSVFQRDRRSFDLWLQADPGLCAVTNRAGQTPLQAATEHNLPEYAERLLELGAPLDLVSAMRLDYMNDFHKLLAQHQGPIPSGWLFEAIRCQRAEAAHALVAAGGDVQATDGEGHSLAYRAQAAHLPELEEWFRTKGCRDTLFDAVTRKDRELLAKILATAPAGVNATNAQARTPLLAALAAGNENLVGFLLEHGANARSRTPDGWTALHLAIANNLLEAGKLLLRAGADPNQLAVQGIGPLHLAAAAGRVEFAELLLTNGADVNLCPPEEGGSFRNSPLHWAAHKGGPEMVKLLLQHGADPKATNGSRDTPGALAEATNRGRSLWFMTPSGLPPLRPKRFTRHQRAEVLRLLKEAEARAGVSRAERKAPS